MATPGQLNVKVFWSKRYDAIVSGYDVTNKTLLCDSNYILDVFMWPKVANFRIFTREVMITSTLYRFDQKKQFFEGWCCFKFNNLGLALGTALKFYRSVAKGLKLKVRNVWELISTFGEVIGEKLSWSQISFLFCKLIRF